ncbi:glycerol-3-phosphate dehydrogenase/oxidase [Flavobacterium amnicola]|uniref:Glycerol-3-phosphate dehydrogenase/oxidase n=1 Tax=Flavobacterium amnicola TaxID=2506422 RepID=A0A4Q1K2D3_9FLAO|nr:glycerol-3-phosphate dehydrogenase/oxidase [Flavobacterium amnicola]RXR19190.1 glycerol-3-phosphate dehydrogenase/oxidase [Flavobacterium amnicola]
MNREEQIHILSQNPTYDIIIIGGGATGLGCAIDATSRGYKTLLLEKHDFAKGTSSRATKLVHGGVRYLAQGNIRLVREALFERGRMLRNAPHVCKVLPFVMPSYTYFDKWFYGTGLWIYEFLSSTLSLGATKFLSKSKTLEYLPDINKKGLVGGILYFDGQFDDSRLAINLAQTAIENGATVLNYCGVSQFIKENNQIVGVVAKDSFNEEEYQIKGKSIINATGVFADDVLQMAEGTSTKTIAPSQGIHLVIDKHFFSGNTALMMPKTDDGRVFFLIPWHDKLVLGTTDTPVKNVALEPQALQEEIDFVLHHFNKYSTSKISRADVKSVFVGLRPLAKVVNESSTAVMPRDHKITILSSGLIHITGGKWTTYRSMAQHTIDIAIQKAQLEFVKCKTKRLKIHGWADVFEPSHLSIYGSDAEKIQKLIQDDSELGEPLHPDYPYTKAEVVWMIHNEMAQTIEDILARRIRLLFLDAKVAKECAVVVASIMAKEKNKSPEWEQQQVVYFTALANQYLI